jgi:hypothetical protein
MHLTDFKRSLHLFIDSNTILQIELFISAKILTKKRMAEQKQAIYAF